jgi:(1->4)-alpha-D-glucan 1-alpha-D-glucosylmutase
VPDFYQGNELIDLSLVDPDNRRPVDYASRAALLDDLHALAQRPDWRERLREMAETPQDGRLKLWTIACLLRHRAHDEALLRDGRYAALQATGERQQHVVAFERRHEGSAWVVVVGRWFASLLANQPQAPVGAATWGDTRVELPALAAGSVLRNLLTGETVAVEAGAVRLAALFETLPFAVLEVAGA